MLKRENEEIFEKEIGRLSQLLFEKAIEHRCGSCFCLFSGAHFEQHV